MNAVLNQFEVMDDIKLSSVEGGGWARCALGTAGSAGLGFLTGSGLVPLLFLLLELYLAVQLADGLAAQLVSQLFVKFFN